MKKWFIKNWNTFAVGFSLGVAIMVIFDIIENVIIKIALIISSN